MSEAGLKLVYNRCHEIIGDGVVQECQDAIASGVCRAKCFCEFGSYLFPGEELREIPEGVEVIGMLVKNCVGPDGCKFSPENKPLICKLAPEVMVQVGWLGSVNALRTETLSVETRALCPVLGNVSEERMYIVSRVLVVLRTAGIWYPDGVQFPRASLRDRFRAFMITVLRDVRNLRRN